MNHTEVIRSILACAVKDGLVDSIGPIEDLPDRRLLGCVKILQAELEGVQEPEATVSGQYGQTTGPKARPGRPSDASGYSSERW